MVSKPDTKTNAERGEGKLGHKGELREEVAQLLMDVVEETKLAKETIAKRDYITLATSDKWSMPWSSPVYYACDDRYNFYWISSQDCIHSLNIRENENIAFVIYDSTVPEGQGFGVYVQATAAPLEDKAEIKRALKILYDRKKRPAPKAEEFFGNTPRKVYKASPNGFWINDLAKKEESMRYLRLKVKLR